MHEDHLHDTLHRALPQERGALLFSFAVVADTHVNERDGASSSPYQTNHHANERARHVFQDIAAMAPPPAFVVHLGDIVHPVPSLPTFATAVELFKSIAAPLKVPLHVVPGNHDVGDKRIDWMPADQVCDAYLDTYREAFGADYYAFDRGDLRFIFVNSLLLNSGLPDEELQRQWLQEQVASAGELRVFMFMHYPPFIFRPDERGNYDNVDEPARSWLVSLMKQPCVEAVFAGHVHNFWYDRIDDAEFYMLPSTAFLRHDFTEFYRVAPSCEFGRGDAEKFGYFVVDVFEAGHIAYSLRTMGARLALGETPAHTPRRHVAHPKSSTFAHVGVELRHPWTESMQITATGGVQEFGRKWARNDYPLLALWEMGARLSKVPDIDLAEAESRERMQLMARIGHRFIVTSLKVPKAADVLAADGARCGIDAFELNMTYERFNACADGWRSFRAATGKKLYLSKIHSFDDSHYDGSTYSHFVKAGFALEELDRFEERLAAGREAGHFDGITVRIESDQDLSACASTLKRFADRTGCLVLASLKLAGKSLAELRADDRANVAKVAHAMILSKTSNRVCYLFDTFMDVDRGYFPRHAFIDRRFNPRPAAQAFTTLTALLSGAESLTTEPRSDHRTGAINFRAGSMQYVLLCEDSADAADYLKTASAPLAIHDLVTGESCTGPAEIGVICRRIDSERQAGLLQVLLLQES